MDHTDHSPAPTKIATAGRYATDVIAKFSPKFLALVSEHLYPSANKAFEELITNSWDADAGNVYVHVPSNLGSPTAGIFILDDGISMDIEGLKQLWTIAESNKRASNYGTRKRIGKFGIGKLATYLLCNELTYICKYSDGVIRIVTMDYRQIDEIRNKNEEKMPLSVRELDMNELRDLLASYEAGLSIYKLIDSGIPSITPSDIYFDEYGGIQESQPLKKETWTIAILTSLKPSGQNIELGRTQYMLRAALPLGNSMKIKINDTVIQPSKSSTEINMHWSIGPALPFDEIMVNGNNLAIEKAAAPFPHVIIPDLGMVTGNVTLFKESIASGKSGFLDDSNGCFVNVLGRVINVNGLGQFSVGISGRGTFAKFRATVRMDGLDKLITIQRDSMVEGKELNIANAFLSRIFNLARTFEEKIEVDAIYQAAKVRQGQLSALPFNKVAAVLEATMDDPGFIPPFIEYDPSSSQSDIAEWIKATRNGQVNSLEGYDIVDVDPKKYLASYDLHSRRIQINKNHPFYIEHSVTSEDQACIEDMVAIHLLTDAYLFERGVAPATIENLIAYRDACERTVAQIRRKSPAQIMQLLNEWSNDATPLEEIVGDALQFLGFSIDRKGNSGDPEGIATALITPKEAGIRRKYTLNYDAKSTTNGVVQTGNVNMAGLKRHRDKYHCNYTLVVGPKFQKGALELEAEDNKVTPMTTQSMCDLLGLTIGYGPLSLEMLEEIFQYRSPDDVSKWVINLKSELGKQRHIDVGVLTNAITSLEAHNDSDVLTCSVIARKYRDIANDREWPNANNIRLILEAFATIAPRSLRIDTESEKVFLFNNAEFIMKEIIRQTQSLATDLKFGAMVTI